jgi:hypothetical protein
VSTVSWAAASRPSRRRDLRHEIKAYVDARLRTGQPEGSFPVADFRGLVETDLGIGLLVERIFRNGELMGPTVRKLAGKEKTLSDDHLALLNEFARELFAWKVRARATAGRPRGGVRRR